jgi:hypothetical protein
MIPRRLWISKAADFISANQGESRSIFHEPSACRE